MAKEECKFIFECRNFLPLVPRNHDMDLQRKNYTTNAFVGSAVNRFYRGINNILYCFSNFRIHKSTRFNYCYKKESKFQHPNIVEERNEERKES